MVASFEGKKELVCSSRCGLLSIMDGGERRCCERSSPWTYKQSSKSCVIALQVDENTRLQCFIRPSKSLFWNQCKICWCTSLIKWVKYRLTDSLRDFSESFACSRVAYWTSKKSDLRVVLQFWGYPGFCTLPTAIRCKPKTLQVSELYEVDLGTLYLSYI